MKVTLFLRTTSHRRIFEAGSEAQVTSEPQKILAILCRANSTSVTKDLGEVLRGFEAAGHGHVKYTRIGNTQHCLGTLNPQAQNKLMRGFPC